MYPQKKNDFPSLCLRKSWSLGLDPSENHPSTSQPKGIQKLQFFESVLAKIKTVVLPGVQGVGSKNLFVLRTPIPNSLKFLKENIFIRPGALPLSVMRTAVGLIFLRCCMFLRLALLPGRWPCALILGQFT